VNYEQIKAAAARLGYSTPDLLALNMNNDPFYVGTDRHLEMAHWFADLWERAGFTGRGGVHLRRAHYRLLDGNAKANGKAVREQQQRLELPLRCQ
jgi:hypothetical protein